MAAHPVPAAALLALALAPGPATAQAPPTPAPRPNFEAAAPSPVAPQVAPAFAPTPGGTAVLSLSAAFAGEGRPIRAGLVWRIFEDKGPGSRLVSKLANPSPIATLPAGSYVVHVSYGLASQSKRLTLGAGPSSERLALAAGALKLAGAIGQAPVSPSRLSFSIFMPLANDSEGRLVAAQVKPGEMVTLPEGSYHVVSRYGDSNAVTRADLKVETGKITEATLNHRAATVTLKLVASAGGEAFAGTAFSVLTPGGDVIREAIGSFPTVTLAEGDYVLIARQAGKVYTREFKVESGLDVDVEVTAPL